MSLQKYLKNVVTISPRATALEAARLMRDHQIGAVIVVSDDGRPIGMVTDRDMAVRVVAEGWPAGNTPVSEVMTPSPTLISEDTPLEEAIARMGDTGHRRLPIVDATGHPVGLLSLDDVMLLVGMELGNVARTLFSGMASRSAPPPHAERVE